MGVCKEGMDSRKSISLVLNGKRLEVKLSRLLVLTGILALLILTFFISWKEVFERFKEINVPMLILPVMFTCGFLLAEAVRLRLILGFPSLEKLIQVFTLSRLLGVATVHTAGEVLLLGGLKLERVPIKTATVSILRLRILDLSTILIVIGFFGKSLFYVFILILACLLLVGILWKLRDFPYLREVILSSLFMYLFFGLSVVSSAKAVGINVGEFELIRASVVGVLSQVLPLSPLGLGTRDLSLIGMLSSLGVSREEALVFSWVEFIAVSFVSSFSLFTVALIWERLKRWQGGL